MEYNTVPEGRINARPCVYCLMARCRSGWRCNGCVTVVSSSYSAVFEEEGESK